MEKIEINKLFKDSLVQTNMRRATFDRLQIRPQVNYRGRTQDEVFFQKQDRRMDFEPEGVFEITVVFNVRRVLNDEYVNKDIDFREYLRTLTAGEFNFLCGNAFSSISLVAAQLTQSFNNVPMITPPVYCGISAKPAAETK